MSLVNKMLRDLDARRAGDGDRTALPAAVTSLASHQETRRGVSMLWPAVILAVTGLGAAAWFGMPSGTLPAPVAVPAAVAPAIPAAATSTPATPATPAPTESGLPGLRLAGELSAPPTTPTEAPRKAAIAQAKLPAVPAAVVSPSRPPLEVQPKVPAALAEARIEKQVRQLSSAERAENEYRRGVQSQRQGNADEAANRYRAVLEDVPEHPAARQLLAALLIEARRFDEAEDVLRAGMEQAPTRLASMLALARLKVERNQAPAALDLLLKNAASGERSAEYQGFAGALLNRAGRAAEAVERYQAATRLAPAEGRWWAGLGIALDATGKSPEAREAYQKARALPGLPADLAQHVEQRLR